MKSHRTPRLSYMAYLAAALGSMIGAYSAPFGSAFTYHGRLTDSGAAANGTYDLEFRLFDSVTGGTQQGVTVTVNDQIVSNGLFAISLDFGGTVFDGSARWLQIAVRPGASSGAFTNLIPRQPVLGTPYALFASNSAAAAFAASTPWSGLTGVPLSLADGIDNDTTYTPGIGLRLGGTEFSLNTDFTDSLYWKVGGNSGSRPPFNFLGTTDNQPLEFKVASSRALRLEPTTDSPNIIGGSINNSVQAGVVGATISGGGWQGLFPNRVTASLATVGGGYANTSSNSAATVSGGGFNTAGGQNSFVGGGHGNESTGSYSAIAGGSANLASADYATVSGGERNRAIAGYATVSGGFGNMATNEYAIVAGGDLNMANGRNSFAAGHRAIAAHDGAFVWADPTEADFASTFPNQFAARAGGGVRFETGGAGMTLDGQPVLSGAVSNSQLPSSVARLDRNQTFTAANNFNNAANTFKGDGSQLTSLNSANLVGTITAPGRVANAATTAASANTPNTIVARDGAGNFAAGTITAADFRWAGSLLAADQGGSIELGNSLSNATVPFIDFHYGVTSNQDFNVRLINSRSGQLTAEAVGGGAMLQLDPSNAWWRADTLAFLNRDWNPLMTWQPNGNVVIDPSNSNTNGLAPGLTFGGNSGEGIASQRGVGGAQWGLDLYTAYQSRMTIANSGNVGIGTRTPEAKLEVAGSSIRLLGIGGNGTRLSLDFATYYPGLNEPAARIQATDHNWGADLDLLTKEPGANGNPLASRLHIDHATGNVGIGTVAPTEKLQVTGNVLAIGAMTAERFAGTGAGTAIGRNNGATGTDSVALGLGNAASGNGAIAAGTGNAAIGDNAVAMGFSSSAAARSLAAGTRARAAHPGSFVWADGLDSDFPSTLENQFNVRASGGVRLETSGAGATLDGARLVTETALDKCWQVTGNIVSPGQFFGTVNDAPLEFRVNGQTALRLQPGIDGPNVIGGSRHNQVRAEASGSTISGGGLDAYQSTANTIWADVATIGGGYGNTIDLWSVGATIAGGTSNRVSGFGIDAAIGGGGNNLCFGYFATVPGGRNNSANGDFSFAAGRRAKANHTGAFVWADSQDAEFSSTADNQFAIRAAGGVRVEGTTSQTLFNLDNTGGLVIPGFFRWAGGSYLRQEQGGAIELGPPLGVGQTPFIDFHYGSNRGEDYNVRLVNDADGQFRIFRNALVGSTGTEMLKLNVLGLWVNGSLASSSDRNLKAGFRQVNPRTILEKVAALPITRWHFTNDIATPHIGPMAQDFHAAFEVGADDKHIATVDADGVALAAIQGLNQKLEEKLAQKETEIMELKRAVAELKELVGKLGVPRAQDASRGTPRSIKRVSGRNHPSREDWLASKNSSR